MDSGGGILATCITVTLSAATGLAAGSVEAVRAILSGMTQAEATLVVGLVVGLVSIAAREAVRVLLWSAERRRKAKQ